MYEKKFLSEELKRNSLIALLAIIILIVAALFNYFIIKQELEAKETQKQKCIQEALLYLKREAD